MGVLIDTSVLIQAERGHLDLSAKLAVRAKEKTYLSGITASELLHGVWRAGDDIRRTRRSAFIEPLLQRLPIINIDLAVARVHANL